jgi:hypothetical protein
VNHRPAPRLAARRFLFAIFEDVRVAWMHPASIEHRSQRFTRPDGDRYLKPDPERWLSPEELRLEHPELYERKYGSLLRRASSSAPPSQLDIIRSDESLRLRALYLLRAAQVQVAMLRHELALRGKAVFRPPHRDELSAQHMELEYTKNLRTRSGSETSLASVGTASNRVTMQMGRRGMALMGASEQMLSCAMTKDRFSPSMM